MTDSKRRKGLDGRAALLGGVLVLSACGGGTAADQGDGGTDGTRHENTKQVDEAAAKDASEAKIKITPEDGATDAGINRDAQVTVSDGQAHRRDHDLGRVQADGRRHALCRRPAGSRTSQLERSTKYKVTAHAKDSKGRTAHENSTFTTVSPENSFIGNFTPEDGSTVGVGMPVSINFDKAITNKAAVQSAIKVTSSSGQKVVGHWFNDKRLDFRPEEYWKADSTVTLKLGLDGVEGAPGVKGVQNKTVTLQGRPLAGQHRRRQGQEMTVMRDGKT